MSKMYYGQIDVSKISKEKLYQGKKGTYLNLTIWVNDEKDNYGNIASIQEGQTKEEREAKRPVNYLGNLKTNDVPQQSTQQSTANTNSPSNVPTDELPF